MQTKKFSLQDFTGGTVLSREQMKNVRGGCTNMECQCAYTPGRWTGCYSDGGSGAINNYCPHGGGCRAQLQSQQ